ncbi:MAG: phosphate ABC transporter permease subunit PstC [Anaerolineales bacterium]
MELILPGEQTKGRFSQSSVPERTRQDKTAQRAFFAIALVPVLLILVVTVALVVRTWPFFEQFTLSELLSGEVWRPARGQFGFRPFILGTIWVTTVGVVIAVPFCLLTSIYLAEYAHNRTRAIAKPVLDLLAAIPPVVYGAWGLLSVVPFVDETLAPLAEKWLASVKIFQVTQPTGFGILAGGIVLAVMITPLIISVIFEVLQTVPNSLRYASLGVGATQWQTIYKVILPQVAPGIIAAIVLGTSRALGETIAVLMVVGNVPNIPTSVFDTAYPLPALIANNYGEMMSIPLYDSALLGAALVLLVVIVIFNLISTLVLQRVLRRR